MLQVIEFMEESDTFLPPIVRFNGIDTVVSISRLAAFTGTDPMLSLPGYHLLYILHNHALSEF